jgi:hypothetical protein
MMTEPARARVRLLFVNEGAYHHADLSIPAAALGRYERLIDCLREEPEVLRELYVDVARLCAAWLVDAQG